MDKLIIDDNTYQIILYDWIDRHDDYTAGFVKRDPDADEFDDRGYWLFYPIGETTPMNAGDLHKLALFIAKLNSGEAK